MSFTSPCRIVVLHDPGTVGPFGLAGSIPAMGVFHKFRKVYIPIHRYMETTIRLNKSVKNKLDSFKIHPNESYNDALKRILEKKANSKIDEDSLIETIEVLSDPTLMRGIKEALEDTSPSVPLEEVKKRLGM